MQVFFKDKKVKAGLEDQATCQKLYGKDMAKKIRLRLEALTAAMLLVDMWPPLSGPERCHELKGDMAGIFSMDVKHPYRLLFQPIDALDIGPEVDEKQRWNSIKSIVILGIKDTHG
jgi:proteic killer suppression protein